MLQVSSCLLVFVSMLAQVINVLPMVSRCLMWSCGASQDVGLNVFTAAMCESIVIAQELTGSVHLVFF
ncbi:hypothetical protein KC19_VG307700 [Ceratodon purpureus]|uniref:Secreted protein n=1 Tax=Ceratodon purpureus TaxID=3225 RepID=A0A8T0HW88_CERPU|nr:hypothetical protein KC19_VG307700 [Ceratodon purpureus]